MTKISRLFSPGTVRLAIGGRQLQQQASINKLFLQQVASRSVSNDALRKNSLVSTSHGRKSSSMPAVQTEPATAAPLLPSAASVSLGPDSLVVEWDPKDGSAPCAFDRDEYPYVWLRENCQCPKCFHEDALGRLFLMSDLDLDIKAESADICKETGNIVVTWPDGHVSPFSPSWLQDRSFSQERREKRTRMARRSHPVFFDSSDPICTHNFDEVLSDDSAALSWLRDLEDTGLTLIKGLGSDPSGLERVIARIAFARPTHYDDYFDVKSKAGPSNLAYTSNTLGLHLDQGEYSYTPGVQLLHCMIQTATEGGENEFADGFHVADIIRREHPEAWRALTRIPVHFWDVGKDLKGGEYHKLNAVPSIKLDFWGDVQQITASNHHRDSFMSAPLEMVRPWYKAIKLFYDLAYKDENLVIYKMEEGDCVVFDNLRVLHGRRGYQLGEGGHRHLRGSYIDWDEVKSRINVLQERTEGRNRTY